MQKFAYHNGWVIEVGHGLPPILVRRRDIRILCTSSIQDAYGPGGWSYLIWGLSLHPIQQAGKRVTAPLIQLHACVEALRELPGGKAVLPPGQTVKVFTDSDYVVKGIHNKEARQLNDSRISPEPLDRAWGELDILAARHPIEWFYYDEWLLREYESLHREAGRRVPDPNGE